MFLNTGLLKTFPGFDAVGSGLLVGIIFHTLGHVCPHISSLKLIVCELLLTDQHDVTGRSKGYSAGCSNRLGCF